MMRPILKIVGFFTLGLIISVAIWTLAEWNRTPVITSTLGLQACCARSGDDLNATSAEFQQSVASAIVDSGAKIKAFKAARTSSGSKSARLDIKLAFSGSTDEVAKTMDRLAQLEPKVAARSIVMTHVETDELQVDLQLVQWSRFKRASMVTPP